MSVKCHLLIIGGPSGSGKNFLIAEACRLFAQQRNDYEKFFMALPQVSTRKMREGEKQGDPYTFMKDKEFERMRKTLGFTTQTSCGKYGTVLTSNLCFFKSKDVINLSGDFPVKDAYYFVISDIQALKELMNENSYTHKFCKENFDTLTTICIDYNAELEENQSRLAGREDRDNNYYCEFKKYAQYVLKNDAGDFISPNQFIDFILGNSPLQRYDKLDYESKNCSDFNVFLEEMRIRDSQ